MRAHELCREWAVVAKLLGTEPYGAYLGLEAARRSGSSRDLPYGVLRHLAEAGGAGDAGGTAGGATRGTGGLAGRLSTAESGRADALLPRVDARQVLAECATTDAPGSWAAVDLGEGRALWLEAYAVRRG